MLVGVYTCQNVKLLEISCRGSYNSGKQLKLGRAWAMASFTEVFALQNQEDHQVKQIGIQIRPMLGTQYLNLVPEQMNVNAMS